MSAASLANVPELINIIAGYLYDDSIFAVPQPDLVSCMLVNSMWFGEAARVLWSRSSWYFYPGLVKNPKLDLDVALAMNDHHRRALYAVAINKVRLPLEKCRVPYVPNLRDALNHARSTTLLVESVSYWNIISGNYKLAKDWGFQRVETEVDVDDVADDSGWFKNFQRAFSEKGREYKLQIQMCDPKSLLRSVENFHEMIKDTKRDHVIEISSAVGSWGDDLSLEDRVKEFASVMRTLFQPNSGTVKKIDISRWNETCVVAFVSCHCRKDMEILYPKLEELRLGTIPLDFLLPLCNVLERCAPKLKLLEWTSGLWGLQHQSTINLASLRTLVFMYTQDDRNESPPHVEALPSLLKNCAQLEKVRISIHTSHTRRHLDDENLRPKESLDAEFADLVSGLPWLKLLEVELPATYSRFGKAVYESLADNCRFLEFFQLEGSCKDDADSIDYTTLESVRMPMFPNLRGCVPECKDQSFKTLHMPKCIGANRLFYDYGNVDVRGLGVRE